ncbi:hypothetical protein D3C77_494060 [compost metagenome]
MDQARRASLTPCPSGSAFDLEGDGLSFEARPGPAGPEGAGEDGGDDGDGEDGVEGEDGRDGGGVDRPAPAPAAARAGPARRAAAPPVMTPARSPAPPTASPPAARAPAPRAGPPVTRAEARLGMKRASMARRMAATRMVRAS